MIKKIIIISLIGVLTLAAVSFALAANLIIVNGETIVHENPGDGEGSLPQTGETWQPEPEDEKLVRSEVELERSEIITLESFPPQFLLHLEGTKGNPCDKLRVVVAEPDEENDIAVDVYRLVDPAGTCIMMLETFDINVPLGDLQPGEYMVIVNGSEVGHLVAP